MICPTLAIVWAPILIAANVAFEKMQKGG